MLAERSLNIYSVQVGKCRLSASERVRTADTAPALTALAAARRLRTADLLCHESILVSLVSVESIAVIHLLVFWLKMIHLL